jgi:Fe-S-cluster containining protein
MNGKPAYFTRQTARKLELPPDKIAELVEQEKLDCPFLGKDEAGKSFCRIYDLRPEICRLFGSNPERHPLLKCPHEEP